jgi:hypothetical protein
MNPPGDSWKGEVWFKITSTILQQGVYINHKSPMGFVDLTFPNANAQKFSSGDVPLEESMSIHQTGKSTAVRLIVPPIKDFSNFEREQLTVEEAFKAVTRLMNFYSRESSRLGTAILKSQALG